MADSDAVTQGDNQLVMQAGAPTLFPELMDYIKNVASGDRLVQSLQEQFPSGPNPLDSGMAAAALDPQALGAAANVALGMAGNMTRPAWHGTPHTFAPEEGAPFGRFRDEAIGSGEGAQAYGYGHYVAGNKRVAEDYQKNLSGGEPGSVTLQGKTFDDLFYNELKDKTLDEIEQLYPTMARSELSAANGNPDKALSTIDKHINTIKNLPTYREESDFFNDEINRLNNTKQWIQDNKDDIGWKPNGALLEVHVLPEEHELLDWDKPLSEQPNHADKLLNMSSKISNSDTGEQAYKMLSSTLGNGRYNDQAASAALHTAGIPGIRYLDAGSRNVRPQLMVGDQSFKSLVPSFDPSRTVIEHTPQELAISNFNRTYSEPHTTDELNKYLNGTEQNLISQRNEHIRFANDLEAEAANPSRYEYEPGKFTESSPTEAMRMATGSREAAAHYDKALEWLQSNRDQFALRARPQTYNYVIFDPSNLRIVGRNGQRLEPVDHDPFAPQGGTP